MRHDEAVDVGTGGKLVDGARERYPVRARDIVGVHVADLHALHVRDRIDAGDASDEVFDADLPGPIVRRTSLGSRSGDRASGCEDDDGREGGV